MSAPWRTLLEGAYARLHDRAEQVRSEVPRLTPYDVLKRTEATQSSFAWGWAAPSEIGEVINSFNAWALQLWPAPTEPYQLKL